MQLFLDTKNSQMALYLGGHLHQMQKGRFKKEQVQAVGYHHMLLMLLRDVFSTEES
jgi:hypothetical protein